MNVLIGLLIFAGVASGVAIFITLMKRRQYPVAFINEETN